MVFGSVVPSVPRASFVRRRSMFKFLGSRTALHSLCCNPVLLSGRLLPQAVALHPVRGPVDIARLLLSQAAALPPMSSHVLVCGRLLPKTSSAVLLAGDRAVLSLSTRPRSELLGMPTKNGGDSFVSQNWPIAVSQTGYCPNAPCGGTWRTTRWVVGACIRGVSEFPDPGGRAFLDGVSLRGA